MEPRFQTSFIPKKPITTTQASKASNESSANIFSIVATVLFIFTVLATGGLFYYKYSLNNQTTESLQKIKDAADAFQVGKIQDLIDINSRLKSTNDLLSKHVVVSKLLLLLQKETLKKVRLSDFTYKSGDTGMPAITMKVESQTYNALASQSDAFSQDEYIKNPKFSDFTPIDNGDVIANFNAYIDPTLVSYKKAVDSLTASSTSQ